MTPVKFRCPHCAGTFEVQPAPKQQKVNCAHCRGLVTIPAATPVAAVAKAAPTVAPPNINVGRGAPKPPGVLPSIEEIESDSPLQPERPTAVPTIPVLSTPIEKLSIHEILSHGRANKVIRMKLDGTVLEEWGKKGAEPGNFNLPHGIVVADDGTVYVTEVGGKRIQKFVR